ncbi:putative ribonuclease H-like domain-containing protein, partial [Tanacetum coccineum]
ELTFLLGLQVQLKGDGINISQDKYMADILKKFNFVTVKTASTPIETNKTLIEDEEAKDVDVHLYGSMVGLFMYLTASRPDIMFAIYACAREVGAKADLNNLETTMNKVWTLVNLPNSKRAIGTNWVFRKRKMIEELSLETRQDWLHKMDVKSAFLYGTIEEEVYVCQPPGFEDLPFPDKVYKVEEVYVDDIIFGTTKKSLCVEFKQMMHKRFQISFMGELTFFLGLQVQQKEDGIFISQDKYVADILKKFDFVTIKTASPPMEPNKALVKDEEAEDVDVHLYKSMIRSLMYLTASRPDITFAVCACARFQVTPKTSHLHAVKRIFRYLKGQPKLGLWYPRDSPFDLEAFSDSDYAGASLDRKSTTGGCQFLGKRLISWQCKKQTIVANSTTKAEYVAAANCCGQVLWIQNQMLDYGFNFMNTKIYIDNESTICIMKNPVFHSKTKHIEIRHHFIRDSYEKRLIQVFNDGFDGCIGLNMLFGPVLRVKHGKKLVSAARLALCCWAKVSTVRHRVSAARQT